MKFDTPLSLEWNRATPILVAGPCSAETEEQVMTTAGQLAEIGIRIYRAGIWKPRTRPGSFEGIGVRGLPWLERVQKEYGLCVMTEVASAYHIEEVLKHGIRMLWIGARTTVNPFLMQEIADALRGVDVSVWVKNPISPDLDLWQGAIERLYKAGVRKLGAIHRGFSSSGEKIYRNTPQWAIPIALRHRYPDLLMLCDPSHMGGHRQWIGALAQQAMDLNFDGLFVEAHSCPDKAWSDASQQLRPEDLKTVLDKLVIRCRESDTIKLSQYRTQLDEYDGQLLDLLARRMDVCRQIGHYKKENNIQVLQATRYGEIIEKHLKKAEALGLSAACVQKIWEAVHEESVRQQMDIVSKEAF